MISNYGACVIREMSLEDIGAVMDLEKETFESPWSAELFRHEIRERDDTIYLVAVNGPRLAGYLGAHLIGKEVHLTNMVVRSDLRRSGLASAMLLECIRRGLEGGARWVTLEVRRGNDEAHAFYRTFDFEDLGLRQRYYSDNGEDAIIMATGDIRSEEYGAVIRRVEAAVRDKVSRGRASCWHSG